MAAARAGASKVVVLLFGPWWPWVVAGRAAAVRGQAAVEIEPSHDFVELVLGIAGPDQQGMGELC